MMVNQKEPGIKEIKCCFLYFEESNRIKIRLVIFYRWVWYGLCLAILVKNYIGVSNRENSSLEKALISI